MINRRMLRNIFAFTFVLFFLYGCSSNPLSSWRSWIPWIDSVEQMPAQQLAYEGMDYYNRGKYSRALEHFQQLKDWYPLSRYAILAELKAADCHYHLENYEEAIIGYEEFENLHPRNEAVPYVVYQIGLSYFNEMETVDRDQTKTQNGLDTFIRLQKQYPDSPFSKQAEEQITASNRNLAGHDMYVGKFYYKNKHYKAALVRFDKVIHAYPDVGLGQEAQEYIDLCQQALKPLDEK
jgi:outer membrane protein assembly factor BamD